MTGFAGKVILISGATGGFGRVAAESFAADGARLVLTDLREDGLAELASRLPGEIVTVAGDIADPQTSARWIAAALERFGQVDAAFNNAGIGHLRAWTAELSKREARRVIDVDVMGVLFAMQAQLGAMMQQVKTGKPGGVILNTASIAGVTGAPQLAAYAAAKHGVVGLGKTAAKEYARFGIRVNTLCPAFMKTPLVMDGIVKGFADEAEGLKKLAFGIPMGRIGEVEEVLPAIRFALDPTNTFFTGQEIRLDGGMTA